MIRPPPRSTLFPSTRSSDRVDTTGMFQYRNLMPRFPVPPGETEESWFRKETFAGLARRFPAGVRSEEHTSELQSRQYLVCRLLLEKKKQRPYTICRHSCRCY